MTALTRRQWLFLAMAIVGVGALHFVFGPSSLQGILFVAITAVVAWHVGPVAGLVAMMLGAVVAHAIRVLALLGITTGTQLRFDRQYVAAFGTYYALSALAIVVGKRHLRTVHALDASRSATAQAERTYREQLEAALIRETAARRDAEQANELREELLRRISQHLRRARELAAIVESSEDAIIGTDLDGHISSWNRAAEVLFGYRADDIIGHSVYRLIPPTHHPEERDAQDRLRRGDNVVHFETVRQRRDGTVFPVSMTISPIRDEHGALVGSSKIVRDIGERTRTEAALIELQKRLVGLVSASATLLRSPHVEDVVPAILSVAQDLMPADGHAVWRRDPQADAWVALASHGLSATFVGLPIREGVDVDLREPIAAEDAGQLTRLESRREAYRREGIASVLVVPLVARDENAGMVTFYYRTRHTFVESEIQAARAFGNLAATALITAELYDAQQRSRRASDFLADTGILLSHAFDLSRTLEEIVRRAVPYLADWCAIDLMTEQGTLHRVAAAHVDPTQLDAVRTSPSSDPPSGAARYSPHHVVRTRESILDTVSTDDDQSASVEPAHATRAESRGTRSYMIVPLVARTGAVGAITFAVGTPGRRYAGADLRFAEALASRIALAVDNARAYEEATQANRLKDEFLATLSHELRTPLNAIVGYVQMLNTGVLDAERVKRALTVLDRNATALMRLVEDVLDVSRFMAGKVQLDLRPADLGAIVEQAVASTRPAADAKGVRLEASLGCDVLWVSGDPNRLQQIIWNLLSNAVKFTERGGRVRVTLCAAPPDVQVVVTDTGCGIAPEFLPHVFERFRQGDARFAREHGGLGLGLAIARDLVQLHGGAIQASSDGDGHGSTFRVQLPLLVDTPGGGVERASRVASSPS
ncbi:MAG: ATP-binding protein [Vicinamibacterales bacterium]